LIDYFFKDFVTAEQSRGRERMLADNLLLFATIDLSDSGEKHSVEKYI
jgi:hypothetical protein